MPLVFPSHAAAVMPLKMWRPRWFDGVALVVGSMAPDLPYAMGAPLPTYGHTWVGLALWGVPLGLVATLLIRRSAPVIAAHLPGWWREYGVLGQVRHRWHVTVLSAWIGAITHRLWDEVTHDHLHGTSLGFAVLSRPLLPGVPWWAALHGASTLIGITGWVWATIHIRRHGLLERWHGPARQVGRRAVLFWSSAGVAMTTGAIASALLPDGHIPIVLGARLLCVSAGAFMVAAATVQLSSSARARSAEVQVNIPADSSWSSATTCGQPLPDGRRSAGGMPGQAQSIEDRLATRDFE
jgi:hypothetical protein